MRSCIRATGRRFGTLLRGSYPETSEVVRKNRITH
nr:MAG TPA: hypothetical protein [Caudoviricetes sp.]